MPAYTALQSIIETAKANAKETRETLPAEKAKQKIEWLKGYVEGFAGGRGEKTEDDRKAIAEFEKYCEKLLA